jgi:hypothetical protein
MSRRSSAAEAFVLGRSMVSKMTNDPRECRANARLCLRRAQKTTRPDTQQLFLDLAASWNRIAAELEAAEGFSHIANGLKPGTARRPATTR